MYNFIVESKSRDGIRYIVRVVRKYLGIENAAYIDIVALIDILSH